MKEMIEKWNLQMFAEECESESATDSNKSEEADRSAGATEDKPDQTSKEDEKKYSDKDVNEILNKKYAKWKADEEKKVSEAEKLANMSAEEKKAQELKTLQDKISKLEAEQTRTELGKQASVLLKENDIDATQDILDFVVGSDAESTKENITKFKAIIDSQIKLHEASRATGSTPKQYGGGEEMSAIERKIAKYNKA